VPLSYSIDRERRIVTITGDYAEPEEWRRLLAAIADDPGYVRGSAFLRDLRGSAHPVSVAAVVGIIGVVRDFWAVLGVTRAAILTATRIDALANVAHALAEDERLPVRAFTSPDDAMAWLQKSGES
jgi:hypothetical protein